MKIAKDTVHHSPLANSHPEMHQYDHPHIIMVTMVLIGFMMIIMSGKNQI